MKGINLVNVSILSRPSIPTHAILPKKKLFTQAAFLMAFPLGIGIILLSSYFDHTFDNPQDADERPVALFSHHCENSDVSEHFTCFLRRTVSRILFHILACTASLLWRWVYPTRQNSARIPGCTHPDQKQGAV
jgi:hypothetical protein